MLPGRFSPEQVHQDVCVLVNSQDNKGAHMGIKVRARAQPHLLMPGETITAVLKKYNLYDASKEEVASLLLQYKAINTDAVQKPGNRVMVPILLRHQAAVFGQK